ncbi:MAG: hypothetical protein DRP57_00790 [Spirochaetes bacterium]|nr:MAG: hypothetical protein DRP57_00790 [Spirochaetota bacterium]
MRNIKSLSSAENKLKKIYKKSAYEMILEQLKELIINGDFSPGQKLPGERILSQRFQSSRTSVRIALKLLEFMKLIEIKPGKGIFVVSNNTSIGHYPQFEWLHKLKQHPLMDLIEARKGIEPYMAELAAEHATVEDINKMEKELESMKLSIKNQKYGIEEASCFHELIFSASGNLILCQIGKSLKSLMYESKKISMTEGNRASQSLKEHQNILYAVKKHDKNLARQTMLKHLNNVEKNLKNKGILV